MDLQVNQQSVYAYTGGKAFDPAIPCVVFIHGALNDHSVWTLLARQLAHHGYSVLALDLPGHGRSDGPLLQDIEAAGTWVLACLDAAGVQQAAFVGHSMGSLIALEAAAQVPARASRLVMVGTAYPMKVSAALLDTAQNDPLAAIDMVNSFSHSTWAAKPSYPGPGGWLHGGSRALMRRVQAGWAPSNLFRHDFQLCNDYANGAHAAQQVSCAVHFVLGERDQMTPSRQTRELATLLKPMVHHLPAGHALMQEDPEGMLKVLQIALKGMLK